MMIMLWRPGKVLPLAFADPLQTLAWPGMMTTDEHYTSLIAEFRELIEGERDSLANMANCAALLYHGLPDLNWAGFYLLRNQQLVLGPFQGRPACVRIDLGKGVCGTSAARRETVVVPNVHQFPGHIACDERSQSEIVVPLVKDHRLLGVLDVDSPILERFSATDAEGLQAIASMLLSGSDF